MAKSKQTPLMIMEYGESGDGKTLDLGLLFGATALYVANPRALECLKKYGFDTSKLRVVQPNQLGDVPGIIKKEKPTSLVFDDLSLAVNQDVRNSTQTGWDLWGDINKSVMRCLDAADDAKIPVGMNAHIMHPFTNDDGDFVSGGPLLPGKKLYKEVSAFIDMTLRVVPLPQRPGWPKGLETGTVDGKPVAEADDGLLDLGGGTSTVRKYIVKCRKDAPEIAPMNVAEILRFNGMEIARLEGMEWCESVIEKLALKFADIAPSARQSLFQAQIPGLRSKYNASAHQIAWIYRDAVDRTDIRNSMKNPLSAFGLTF